MPAGLSSYSISTLTRVFYAELPAIIARPMMVMTLTSSQLNTFFLVQLFDLTWTTFATSQVYRRFLADILQIEQ